ncbi:FAD-binding domain-containing protein [Aspergillus californicus]
MIISISASAYLSCLLLVILTRNVTSTSNNPLRNCRCLPHDHCWPSPDEWDAFNNDIHGTLLRVWPIGSVCHGVTFDQARCDNVRASTHDTLWRISEPAGALQANNWEGDETHGSCTIDSIRETVCKQGRIPLYAVMARSAQDVQAAVRFTRSKNLHVAIRNTGHDGIGRSSGPNSLQINVSRLKEIQFTDEFLLQGGNEPQGSAVTVGAGVLGMELLAPARVQGLNVITGTCSSVGAAGGFLQGGVTSLLGPAYGMSSDNALEFNIVTAMGLTLVLYGDLVVANQYINGDLFWALRGGGGGTFGVVVNTTIRTFPDVPAVLLLLTATIPRNEIAGRITESLPDLKCFDNATSAIIVHRMFEDRASLSAEVLFINTSDVHLVESRLTTLFAGLDDDGLPYNASLTVYPRLSTHLAQPRSLDRGGYGLVEGSVLISEERILRPDGASEIMAALSGLEYRIGDSVEIFMCAGGQVKANKGISSALLPAWREAGLLLTIRRALRPDSLEKEMSNNQLPALRSLESPYLGSYLNVADPGESSPKRAFWGDNYNTLYRIKQRWDRDGLFIVRLGVGSEDWDEEGICRLQAM